MCREPDQEVVPDQPPRFAGVGVVLSEVDAVGRARNREIGPVVHYEQRVVGVAQPAEHPPRSDDRVLIARLLPELHDVHPALEGGAEKLLRIATAGPRLADEIETSTAKPRASPLRDLFGGHQVLNWAVPVTGVEASACSLRGMRPASYASRPAS